MTIKIDASVYDEKVIHKVLYWMEKDYCPTVTFQDQRSYQVDIHKKDGEQFSVEEERAVKETFFNSLIDYKTRSIILSETKNIRDLIIMKAFFPFSNEDINFSNLIKDDL
jgi:His-Xaa-Ser system protein HxsD